MEPVPDIVVFDESFVDHDVPFAAFTAHRALFDAWNQPGRPTFHSTTYQPNAISSLHFLACLRRFDPEFHAAVAGELEQIARDPARCAALLGRLYSPFLAKAIATLGFDTPEVRASGHYILTPDRRVFDGVAGVACSIRGHNPETYVADVADVAGVEGAGDDSHVHRAVAERLKELTGLEHLLPAVSGASAVENALRVGLVARHPRKYVLAFRGGFGGKTLLALTGTANPWYKSHLDPLYDKVLYLDPFAATALDDLERTLRDYPVAVVQLELIQAVGGVRPLPPALLRHLQDNRQRRGYLLLVDEVQTGLYRTGPFIRSRELGLTPDLLTLGKGTSDMMFPFALTLYSAGVQGRLDQLQPGLPGAIRQRYDYAWGYRTVLHTLQWAEGSGLSERVRQTGALFASQLAERLASCKAVRAVRAHGLLIGIELDPDGWWRRRLGKRLSAMYLLSMLRHRSFPLFIGFCQYEPNVLKLTPPLTTTPEEVRQVCQTIAEVLSRPLPRLIPSALTAMAKASLRRKWPRGRHRA